MQWLREPDFICSQRQAETSSSFLHFHKAEMDPFPEALITSIADGGANPELDVEKGSTKDVMTRVTASLHVL
jgi:hypothetical protein